MRSALRLRQTIWGALGLSAAGLLGAGGCGAEVVVDDGGGSGGGAASSGNGSSSGNASSGSGTIMPPPCSGTLNEVCQNPNADGVCAAPSSVEDGCCNSPEEPAHMVGGQCCYWICEQGCCGRPFVVAGVARTAESAERADWCAPLSPAMSSEAALLADAWERDALDEHASIASFARFTLELMAHGAPPDLLADAQRAGMDEVEHARLCFGQAARFRAVAVGPAALDVGGLEARTLVESAVAAVAEGCIGETVAALVAREQLAVAQDASTREVLRRIADDEERHAALAWRFVAWAIGRGGDAVRRAVAEAFSRSEDSCTHRVLAATGKEATLHAFGRLLPHEQRAVEHAAWREVIAPSAALLLAGQGSAPRERVSGGLLAAT